MALPSRRRKDGPLPPWGRAPTSTPGLAGALLELSATCRTAPDSDTVHRATTRAAVRLTGSRQSTLRLLDAQGRRLLVAARCGPSMHGPGASRFAADEGFQGWVCRNREPALTNDPLRDARFERRDGQKWAPTALAAVPLIGREGTLGVLAMARDDGYPYTEADLDLLRLVVEVALPHIETRRLERITLTDPLTLLLNRRALQQRFGTALADAAARGTSLSAVLLDLDHFHDVNSDFGLDVGDDVLVAVAERLRAACREEDLVFRWGGEEFLVLLPGLALDEATGVAERLRAHLAEVPCETRREPVTVTASLGTATATDEENENAFFHRLDQAMRRAKRKGRNRVEEG